MSAQAVLRRLGEASAADAPTRFLDSNGRVLAYRSIGAGKPIVLCMRFRGTMDDWDPAFLDAVAARGHRVITFDYSGLGQSTGVATYNPVEMAADPRDLIAGLELGPCVLGGWSLGGLAAQCALALHPQDIEQLVLIATGPPGPMVKPAEQIFYDVAGKETNDLEDNIILFFEPASPESRDAARRSLKRISARRADRSPAVPVDFARAALDGGPRNPSFPAPFVLETLKATRVPILHVGGDHDIIFPVENWYALNQSLKTLSLFTLPRAGHGPQHQNPELAADVIASFIRNT